jgi:hypothetical protein
MKKYRHSLIRILLNHPRLLEDCSVLALVVKAVFVLILSVLNTEGKESLTLT